MNLIDIEKNINNLTKIIESDLKSIKENFIYEFLSCYGIPKASITKLKNGNINISKNKEEILWKKKLFFKQCSDRDIYEEFLSINNNKIILKNEPRFIIITNYNKLIALDTKLNKTLDININEIYIYYTFFLAWAGMEKVNTKFENHVDIKAAEKMARIYDEVRKENEFMIGNQVHHFNIFWARILFCFFAEDTGLFESKLFTNSIESYTQSDGSDLNLVLEKIFQALDTENKDNYPEYLKRFPYVGGKLFKDKHIKLNFTAKSRKALVESGRLEWCDVNPDIFGSMIQAVVNPEERSSSGMHYTSVTNILKVIKPLFLNDLEHEFEIFKNNSMKLKVLLTRLSRIKIFDPACGSGNFLLIAYRELRELEMKIIQKINELEYPQIYANATNISLNNFYGIELDNFAHEIAKLSLWLMEHKMEAKFNKKFGMRKEIFPIVEEANIINANSLRIEWNDICPIDDTYEIYLLGNPPYLGSKVQNFEQRHDLDVVFKGIKKYKELDYIACWFYKGAKYINRYNAKCAFVSTNSICQGEQVGLLWPNIFKLGIDINFAYTSFKWENNAKNNAAVICVIIGLCNKNVKNIKNIYSNNIVKTVKNINPYLIEGKNIIIEKRKKSISNFPEIKFGNMANDGGGLIFSTEEKIELTQKYPETNKFFRKLVGSQEFIRNKKRWCLWIENDELNEALKYKPIAERIQKVREHRLKSKDLGTNKLAERPHQFRDRNVSINSAIIIPRVSSEKREYIPIGFLDRDIIILDSAQAIYDSEIWIFGVITSKMHMLWVKTVGGRLKTDYRYSKEICYNTFPFPRITKKQGYDIRECVFDILQEREKNPEKSLDYLYNPDKMPMGLRKAHEKLDMIIDKCYSKHTFNSDEERLECLFDLYEKMV